jgi:hypothetical protein
MTTNGLSLDLQQLLEALPPDGSMVGNIRLRSSLNWTDEAYTEAIGELKEAGLIRQGRGRGGSVGRVLSSMPEPQRSIDPPGDLAQRNVLQVDPSAVGPTPNAQRLLGELPTNGAMVSNTRLRSMVGLDNEDYAQAIEALRQAERIRFGKGRGGSVGRVVPEAPVPMVEDREVSEDVEPENGGARRESELYEPFAAWLNSAWEHTDVRFAHARVTATPRGRIRDSGQWSRPDVTSVQVWRYEWLPQVEVQVATYELKRAAEATRLESVYEAASHGRWAHRASLVIEEDPAGGALPRRFLDEIRRFQLGLFIVRFRSGQDLDVERRIEPGPQNPALEDVDELIAHFFEGESRRRSAYRTAIGR